MSSHHRPHSSMRRTASQGEVERAAAWRGPSPGRPTGRLEEP